MSLGFKAGSKGYGKSEMGAQYNFVTILMIPIPYRRPVTGALQGFTLPGWIYQKQKTSDI